MKKISYWLLMALLIPVFVQASDDCLDADDNSCSEAEAVVPRLTLEEKQKQRLQNLRRSYFTAAKNSNASRKSRPNFLRYTGRTTDDRPQDASLNGRKTATGQNSETDDSKKRSVRRNTMPNFQAIQSMMKDKKTQAESKPSERRTRRPAIRSAVSDQLRQGSLSNEPKWSEITQRHYKKNLGEERYWKGTEMQDRRDENENYIYRGLELRQIWRGQRMDGNLEGEDLK